MCKHILNAQVQVRAPCCRTWFDCNLCHEEQRPDHPIQAKEEIILMCKKCKRAFRKDFKGYEESDEYCPHCDNHYVIEAITPKPVLKVESEDTRVDARMLKDDRIRGETLRTIFNVPDSADRLG